MFEAGMVMAHFPRRTVIVQIGYIRPFSDLSGIHFVKLDNSMDARREARTEASNGRLCDRFT